jgi:flagellar biosynthetic protein FliR
VTIDAAPAFILGFVLAVVRAAAWIVVVPPFNSRTIPTLVKMGLAAGLALPVAASMGHQNIPTDAAPLIGAVILQVMVGLTLGFVVHLLLASMQAAGELIDVFGGFTVAPAFDPLSNAQSSTFGRYYQLLAATLLFAINGHVLLVKGFLTSFDAIGVQGPILSDLSDRLIGFFGLFFLAAVEIAAPLLAVLFLTEVSLGLLSKAAPQMNVFMLGFPVKILLTLLLAGVTFPLLTGTLTTLLTRALQGGALLTRAFAG